VWGSCPPCAKKVSSTASWTSRFVCGQCFNAGRRESLLEISEFAGPFRLLVVVPVGCDALGSQSQQSMPANTFGSPQTDQSEWGSWLFRLHETSSLSFLSYNWRALPEDSPKRAGLENDYQRLAELHNGHRPDEAATLTLTECCSFSAANIGFTIWCPRCSLEHRRGHKSILELGRSHQTRPQPLT